MQKNICVVLLVAIVLNAVAAGPTHTFQWPASVDTTGKINFYRQFYEYAIAVMNQGIPPLGVAPLDPLQLNVTLTFEGEPETTRSKNSEYPQMTMEIIGLTVSGFSDIVVDNATIDFVALTSLLELSNEHVSIVSNDVRVNATDYSGVVHYASCSRMTADVFTNSFFGYKQLSLNGTILQVDDLTMDFESGQTNVWAYLADCSGEFDILQEVVDTIDDHLNTLVYEQIPDHLNEMADEWKIILNDIFSLRNVTDSETEVTRDSSKPLPRKNISSSHKDGRVASKKHSISRSSYQKNSSRRLEASPMHIKYDF